MKEGDFIVGIGDKDVKWASHEQVVRMIKQCGDFINLKLVTPMDRNYLKVNDKIYNWYHSKKENTYSNVWCDTLINKEKIFLRTFTAMILII